MLFGLLGMIFKAFYLNHDNAYIRGDLFPLAGAIAADFETRHSTTYTVGIAFPPSEELRKVRALTYRGDAYEGSEHLGRYVLNSTKLNLVALSPSHVELEQAFHIFGPHPQLFSEYRWDPHAT